MTVEAVSAQLKHCIISYTDCNIRYSVSTVIILRLITQLFIKQNISNKCTVDRVLFDILTPRSGIMIYVHSACACLNGCGPTVEKSDAKVSLAYVNARSRPLLKPNKYSYSFPKIVISRDEDADSADLFALPMLSILEIDSFEKAILV